MEYTPTGSENIEPKDEEQKEKEIDQKNYQNRFLIGFLATGVVLDRFVVKFRARKWSQNRKWWVLFTVDGKYRTVIRDGTFLKKKNNIFL